MADIRQLLNEGLSIRVPDAEPLSRLRDRIRARWRRRVGGLAALTAIMAVAIVVPLITTGQSAERVSTVGQSPQGTKASVPSTQPSPTTSPTLSPSLAPAGVRILSWSFVTTNDGWLLGSASCGSAPCAVVMRTADGGRSWAPLSIPRAAADVGHDGCSNDTPPTPCVAGIRFATVSTGYLFGPSLLVTEDGGRTWSSRPAPQIADLEVQGGRIVRLVQSCSGCTRSLQIAPVGSDTWTSVPTPEGVSSLVVADKDTMYLVAATPVGAGPGNSLVFRGSGSGSWSPLGSPCDGASAGGAGSPLQLVSIAATGAVLAAECASAQIAPQQAGYQQGLRVSVDSGQHFGPQLTIPRSAGYDGGSSAEQLAVGSANTMVVVGTEGGVQTTSDGGHTWEMTLPPATPAEINTGMCYSCQAGSGFETPEVGHVVTPDNTFWTTRDGGRHWESFTFRPSS